MNDTELRELVREAAPTPPRPLNTQRAIARGRRLRTRRRIAAATSAVCVLAVAGVLVSQVLPGADRGVVVGSGRSGIGALDGPAVDGQTIDELPPWVAEIIQDMPAVVHAATIDEWDHYIAADPQQGQLCLVIADGSGFGVSRCGPYRPTDDARGGFAVSLTWTEPLSGDPRLSAVVADGPHELVIGEQSHPVTNNIVSVPLPSSGSGVAELRGADTAVAVKVPTIENRPFIEDPELTAVARARFTDCVEDQIGHSVEGLLMAVSVARELWVGGWGYTSSASEDGPSATTDRDRTVGSSGNECENKLLRDLHLAPWTGPAPAQ